MKRNNHLLAVLLLTTSFCLNQPVMAQSTIPAAQDPNILKDIRAFLQVLNSGDGKPLETLSPADARLILVNAQKSVTYDYSDIEESEKTITEDGLTVKIHMK